MKCFVPSHELKGTMRAELESLSHTANIMPGRDMQSCIMPHPGDHEDAWRTCVSPRVSGPLQIGMYTPNVDDL